MAGRGVTYVHCGHNSIESNFEIHTPIILNREEANKMSTTAPELRQAKKTISPAGNSGSRRAALLADRIEEGAAFLAAFAEGLSEAEWRAPVSDSDHRSVGVIVHHVATAYPIEIDLARAIASGKTVTDVTWEVVAQLNAKHADEQADVTKTAAIELLRQAIAARLRPPCARSRMTVGHRSALLAELWRARHRTVRHRGPCPPS